MLILFKPSSVQPCYHWMHWCAVTYHCHPLSKKNPLTVNHRYTIHIPRLCGVGYNISFILEIENIKPTNLRIHTWYCLPMTCAIVYPRAIVYSLSHLYRQVRTDNAKGHVKMGIYPHRDSNPWPFELQCVNQHIILVIFGYLLLSIVTYLKISPNCTQISKLLKFTFYTLLYKHVIIMYCRNCL